MKPEPITPETESSSTIEADHDFLGAASPHCIIHDPVRRDAVRQVVTDYAHTKDLPESIAWATLRASNALDAGESAHRAIEAGQTAVDEWPRFFGAIHNDCAFPTDWDEAYKAGVDPAPVSPKQHTAPVTAAWNAARSMGLSAIHCTASGVAGYYGRMYVAISANNGD